MTPNPKDAAKSMEEIRNELFENKLRDIPIYSPKGDGDIIARRIAHGFIEGWNACQTEMEKRVQPLLDALISIQRWKKMVNAPEHELRHAIAVDIPYEAAEALADWEKNK